MHRCSSLILLLTLALIVSPVVSLGTDELVPTVIFEGHDDEVICARFSPDSQHVLTGSYDRTAKLWDAETGEIVLSLDGHPYSVTSVAFSPDGSMIGTTSPSTDEQGVFLWNAQSGKLLHSFSHKGAFAVAFSPDGKELVSSGLHGKIKFWHLGSKELIDTIYVQGWQMTSLAYSPDGARLLVGATHPHPYGGEDTVGVLLRTDTKEILASYDNPKTGNSYGPPVAYSPEGSFYAMSTWVAFRIFDAKTFSTVRKINDSVNILAFSPDGTKILGDNRLYDIGSGQVVRIFRPELWRGVRFYAGAYSPDATKILIGNTVWDVSDLVTGVTEWAKH